MRRRGGILPWLEGFAPLPEIPDPVERLSAHLVARTIDLVLAAVGLFIAILLLAPAPAPHAYALTLPVGIVFLLALRRFLQRGHVRAVARALCTVGWVTIGVDLWLYGPNTIATGGFVILIMVAGLTLGAAGAVALSIATFLALAPFMLGLVPGPFPTPTNPGRLVHYTTQLALGATLASWWSRRMRALLHAEAERLALHQRLASVRRMETMGRMAGGVAHDFNNLLTIILCAADSVPDGPASEALADIRDAAQRGAVLTRQLLTFSRRQVSHPVPNDVNRAIRDIQPMLQRLLGDSITADLNLAPELPAVVIDPAQLDQVLLNLAANARDAMPNGGTLTITTARQGDERVEIVVTDTGCGMDAATLASVFEPFFTTKGERGTGLGLAVVDGVVRAAGGQVTATSEPGRGTAFRVTLPSSDRAAHQVSPVSGAAQRKPWRVALIDDDARVRRAVAASLRAASFVVDEIAAPRTLDDVGSIEERLRGMHALVTDIVMPQVNGVDLAVELRRRGCTVPIVFVSGFAEHERVERTRSVERSRWLQKPFTASELSQALEELAGGHDLGGVAGGS